MKEPKRKFVPPGLALLAAITMILLPLDGCKNDTVSETPKYTVKFEKNAEDATGEMKSQTFTEGGQALSANQFKRDTWTFSGWSEDKAATIATWGDKAEGDKYTVTKDVTLVAKWREGITIGDPAATIAGIPGAGIYTLVVTNGAQTQRQLKGLYVLWQATSQRRR